MTAYVLTPGKEAAKLKAVDAGVSDVHTSKGVARNRISGKLTMPYFAGLLSNMMDRPVIDMTELEGVYDMNVEWAVADVSGREVDASLPTILREQLGLRLENRKVPVDIYAIDRIDREPREN